MKIAATSLALACLLLAACDRRAASKPPEVGSAAPQFSVNDSGRTVSLAQYRGRVVVLNFWATWCPPCVEELPSFTAMATDATKRGIVVLAVSEDESESDYLKFVKEHPFGDATPLHDSQRIAAPLYGTYLYPETYVIDAQGIIRRKFIGATDWTKPDILESLVRIQGETPGPSRAAK